MIMKKLKKSVLLRVNSIIAGILVCMIGMLAYSNVHAVHAIREKSQKTYQSMGEYYVNDLMVNLNNMAVYLLQISETVDYYELSYQGKNQEFIKATAKQKLYNKLNEDVLICRPTDYFFIYQKNKDNMMLVQSSLKVAKTSDRYIEKSLKPLITNHYKKEAQWELIRIDNHQYLINTLDAGEAILGCMVSVDRLTQSIQVVNLNEYFVTYSKGEMNSASDKKMNTDLRISVPIERTDAYVNIIIPRKNLYSEINPFIRTSILFAVILIILLPILCITMNRWFVKPIRHMVTVMRRVDDKGIEIRMPDMSSMGEYQIVSKTFNSMMEKIAALKIDVYEKERKKQELYEQYTLLQINPHFFLNALNTIFLLNKRGDTGRVGMVTTYLIKYFRSAFSHKDDMVLVKEEIDFTLNYMAIQRLRHSDNIHFVCKIDKETELCRVPAMCVLTFVENSIKYSTDFSKDLTITVSSELQEAELHIIIEDNGKGIPQDILDRLKKNETIIKNDREHIGIKNVADRFFMHYKEQAKIQVKNKEAGGVVVTLDLPAEV